MTNVIPRLLCWFLLLIRRFKGHYFVEEIKHPKNTLGSLIGYSVSGYTIEIFCQKRHYRRHYDSWFVPNEDHVAYHVFSTASSGAPEILKQACQLDLDIPALLPSFVPDEGQREEVVRTYLDLLIQRLGPERDLAHKRHLKVSHK